ncbi:MAG: diaminopimelate decarboxylase [Oscillospiraceae bacterium]|jgi:diaminopimelate decarboxylase|nr:diaminopimelate decarboxylase [Oscillospiraceae bacterium]
MEFVSDCLGLNERDRLTIGGADVAELAREFGTPLYLMDEDAVRRNCRAFTGAMSASYPGKWAVAYANKALSCKHLVRVTREEGLYANAAGGGEVYTALKAGMPPEKIIFHGNNKTGEELRLAIGSGILRIVADGPEELRNISRIAAETGRTASVSIRLSPGIEAHTYEVLQTGKLDSKFGVPIETGAAMEAVRLALSLDGIDLYGVHCHIGSQIFEPEPFAMAVDVMAAFMVKVRDELSHTLKELNLGGGYGIRYTSDQRPRGIRESVSATAEAVRAAAEKHNFPLPELVIEPGRGIVAGAGITVYTVGGVKEIPGVRTYVSVDGGMTDNPRYVLYGAQYEITLPERAAEAKTQIVTLAGRCCENELLGKDMPVQPVRAGDLLAVLCTGAYNYSMASNYNRVPRPPVVMVSGGKPFVAVRRETWEDVAGLDN